MRKQEMEIDYLAPFLAQMSDPEKITRQQACKLKEDCLADLKQRLIDKANLIQARFEKVGIEACFFRLILRHRNLFFLLPVLNFHPRGVFTALFGCYMAGAT